MGRDLSGGYRQVQRGISTHAPLAGRDQCLRRSNLKTIANFNPRAPCGARREKPWENVPVRNISTHAPLAGRDWARIRRYFFPRNFNPRAPCGARPGSWYHQPGRGTFQPTRPLRGATKAEHPVPHGLDIFQPTRPLRGATTHGLSPPGKKQISTHAPLAGRDNAIRRYTSVPSLDFNPRAPCGARPGR